MSGSDGLEILQNHSHTTSWTNEPTPPLLYASSNSEISPTDPTTLRVPIPHNDFDEFDLSYKEEEQFHSDNDKEGTDMGTMNQAEEFRVKNSYAAQRQLSQTQSQVDEAYSTKDLNPVRSLGEVSAIATPSSLNPINESSFTSVTSNAGVGKQCQNQNTPTKVITKPPAASTVACVEAFKFGRAPNAKPVDASLILKAGPKAFMQRSRLVQPPRAVNLYRELNG